jgi:hypothetical protein
VDFNAHVAGCVLAVSDNTHHHLSHQPSSIRAPMNKRGSLKNVTFSADTVLPEEVLSPSLVGLWLVMLTLLLYRIPYHH